MTLNSFFNEYQHFYLIEGQGVDSQYLLYESPPTYTYNWQWEADPEEFYKKTKMYNGVRAANLTSICCLPELKQQSRKIMSKLIQGVLLRGKHNRMYHYDFRQKFPGKTYQQSVELPVDWLIYYDSLSRVSRNPTELYSFKLFSVPYLILRDRTKRESHYYHATEDFNSDELIPSERLQITVCHSEYSTHPSTTKNLLRKNIFLPNVRHPFILNYSSTENIQLDNTGTTRKTYTYFYGKDHTLQNFSYIRELSFSNSLFKNIYYQSVQQDLKNIENKIGRDYDPLFKHPYFQIIIKTKQAEFEKNRPKFFKAHCEPVVESTTTGSTLLNKSTAHSEERDADLKIFEKPTSESSKFKNFENLYDGTNFKCPPAPARTFKRQTVIGTTPCPHWWKRHSQVSTHFACDPMTFLPQDVCEANLASQDLCPYDADELESARSLRTLKTANLRTEHRTEGDRTDFQQFDGTDPIGLRYIRKRTNSDDSTSTGTKQQEPKRRRTV